MPKPTIRPTVRRRIAAVLAAVALGLGPALGAGTPAAQAVGPITLSSGQITDQANALGGTKGQVQAAIDGLYKSRGIDLYVAYVPDFSGASPTTWADTTATRNGLGTNDVLLAVATNARQYAFSVDNGFPISQAAMNQVANVAVEPSLRTSNWAAAAIGATQGLGQAAAGQTVTTPTFSAAIANATAPAAKSSSGKGALWAVLFVVLAAVVVIGALMLKRRRAAAGETGGGGRSGGSGNGPRGPARPSLKELENEAASLLISTDDAVKTSEQELGFAVAQFGGEAAATFRTALDAAKSDLADAFRLRSKLDENQETGPEQRYNSLLQIVAKCKKANANLDAQTASFEQLRDLQNRTPEVLAELETTLHAAPGRIDAAHSALQQAGGRYSAQALEPVAQNPAQAAQLVTFAAGAVGEGRRQLTAGDGGQAAVAARSAQEAVGQIDLLADAVDRRIADLDQAQAGLPAMVAEIDGEIVEARGLLGSSVPAGAQRLAALEAEAARVRAQATAGPGDPLAMLGQLQAVDAQLDELLEGLRGEHERQASARAMLDQGLLAARSDVAAAGDFITTRRGAIGSQARTFQAEALRQLDKAQQLRAQGDAPAALDAARQASNYARSAQQQAASDVQSFGNPGMGNMGLGGGLMGGGARSAAGGGAMGGLLGAVIGGLVAEGLSGGGRGGAGGRGRTGPRTGGFQGAPPSNRRGSGGRF
jgi:TPM domain